MDYLQRMPEEDAQWREATNTARPKITNKPLDNSGVQCYIEHQEINNERSKEGADQVVGFKCSDAGDRIR
jgi:hypothetical protein